MNREVLQEPAVATTGGAASAASCGSSGIQVSTTSDDGNCNYRIRKDLRRDGEENFKTGPIDRSGTSPQPT